MLLLYLLLYLAFCEEINFLEVIRGSRETSKALGLDKLSPREQGVLNALLNQAYSLGAASQMERVSLPKTRPDRVTSIPASTAFLTKVDDDDDEILNLTNGAIVKIANRYSGFVGFRKTAVLYSDRGRWKIWAEGKRAYSCNLLKAPQTTPNISPEKLYVSEVSSNGSVLRTLDGRIFEVASTDTFHTSLWLGHFDALLVNQDQLLNLDDSDPIINVTQIK